MTDDSLILEHLKAIRADTTALRADMDDVKYRLSSIQQQVAGLRADLAHYSVRQFPDCQFLLV